MCRISITTNILMTSPCRTPEFQEWDSTDTGSRDRGPPHFFLKQSCYPVIPPGASKRWYMLPPVPVDRLSHLLHLLCQRQKSCTSPAASTRRDRQRTESSRGLIHFLVSSDRVEDGSGPRDYISRLCFAALCDNLQ